VFYCGENFFAALYFDEEELICGQLGEDFFERWDALVCEARTFPGACMAIFAGHCNG